MSGFVVAYREAVEHPLFQGNAERLGAWMWLVMKAAWKPTPFDIAGKIVTIERGQVCVSRAQLAKAWGMSPSGVERFLTRLKTEQMIEQATGQGKSVITICNYSKYQDVSDDAGQPTGQATGQQSDSHRTTKEQGNKITSYKDNTDVLSSVISGDDDFGQSPIPALPKIQSSEIDEAVACWNMAAAQTGWPVIRALGPDRQKKLAARLKENGLEGWKEALRKAFRSEQLGRDPPGWFSFPWLIANTNNILKVLEGNYDKRFGTSGGSGIGSYQPDTGPINPMVQAVVARQARRAGQQQRQHGDDAGGWPPDGCDTQILL